MAKATRENMRAILTAVIVGVVLIGLTASGRISNPSSSSGGITSLNGLSGATQTLATSTTGTDVSVVSSGTAHTFAFPSSSGTNRGLLSSADWTTFNGKYGPGGTDVAIADGGTAISTAPTTHGQLLMASSSIWTIGSLLAGSNITLTTSTPGQITIAATAGSSFWTTVPGTPTRVSNTQFTVTDTGNAGAYDSLLSRGVVLKWTDTTTKEAMIVSSSYGADAVTVNIMGDTLAASATMNTMKYSANKAKSLTFGYAGTIATSTDIMGRYFAGMPMRVFGADAYIAVAGSGTATTTIDINKNGTSIFTTKLNIGATATSTLAGAADSEASLTTQDYVSVDIDAVPSTPGVDAYVYLWVSPLRDENL